MAYVDSWVSHVLDGQGDVSGRVKNISEGLEDLFDCMGNVLGGQQDAVG